ncbi:hypothetical protein GCM10022243_48210 [Saccharothrix violaceirubra]|uniref:Uncharacterized protein n=1 Tax=Saccharothrix violaceirubra TaxID=413306 RepID=A0A7W7T0M2_9PSEU|nr:hypothetical protein [Saccharothrix violaceirubra]MBB4963837.1 hypothetical protein [Saccharothrix violaceirubra]
MARLNTHVSVNGDWYGPDDDVPDEVADRITNPDVWSEPPSRRVQESEPDAEGEGEGPADMPVPPPRRGPGSGGPAWIEYARQVGVTGEFDSKDALIGELERRGLLPKEA